MNRRTFLKHASLAAAGIGAGLHFSCSGAARKKPNIILILADDMGFSDLGCYGSEIHTPNLDRLANEGVRFSHFYNNARCCPSRASLLSGVYPHQAGIGGMTDTDIPIPEYQGYFKDNVITVADLLRSAGYTTYLSGKWHVGAEPEHWPRQHGFDRCFAFINGAASYYDFEPYRNELWPPGNELTLVRDDQKIEMTDMEFYATDLYTDHAIQFLENHDATNPFFLYLSYTAPHWPLHALPEDIKKYDGVYDDGWDVIREQRFQRLRDLGVIHPDTELSAKSDPDRDWGKLTDEEKERETRLMTVYAAMIDRMDQNIGRLLDHLKESDQLDNTVIFFLSDNGGCATGNLAYSKYAHSRFDPEAPAGGPESFTGYGADWANVSNTPFRLFKAKVHEGGIATPFIAWYPKHFKKGVISHEKGHIVDIMPTLVELAGTEYPEAFNGKKIIPNEGRSLMPVFRDKKQLPKRTLFFEHMGHCSVIDGDWKMVRLRNEDWELYNLKTDRSETTNLAVTEPEKLAELVLKYERWAEENKVLPWEEVEKKIPYKF